VRKHRLAQWRWNASDVRADGRTRAELVARRAGQRVPEATRRVGACLGQRAVPRALVREDLVASSSGVREPLTTTLREPQSNDISNSSPRARIHSSVRRRSSAAAFQPGDMRNLSQGNAIGSLALATTGFQVFPGARALLGVDVRAILVARRPVAISLRAHDRAGFAHTSVCARNVLVPLGRTEHGDGSTPSRRGCPRSSVEATVSNVVRHQERIPAPSPESEPA
jgi:hypothetical protein